MRVLLALWSILITVGFVLCLVKYEPQQDEEKEAALEDCLEAVQNKCASVIEYAVMLEKENAKLNRRLKACREK